MYLCIELSLKDDRDDLDAPIERDANECIEETSDQQSDPVSDYQLGMDCNEMSITIDEVSMGANDDPDTPADTSNYALNEATSKQYSGTTQTYTCFSHLFHFSAQC